MAQFLLFPIFFAQFTDEELRLLNSKMSRDGVLGIRFQDRRLEGADECIGLGMGGCPK